MKIPEFELETVRVIHNNKEGYSFEVGPDADGFGCVEIRYKETDRISERMSMPPECAELIAKAIVLCADEVKTAKINTIT